MRALSAAVVWSMAPVWSMAVASLCARAGAASPAAPGSQASSQDRAPIGAERVQRERQRARERDPWLYVAGSFSNFIDAYDLREPGMPLVETISAGVDNPGDLAVDAQGTLYVDNGSGTVAVYPAGATTPSLTIPVVNPAGVAVAEITTSTLRLARNRRASSFTTKAKRPHGGPSPTNSSPYRGS
jgi:hypothetical protein